MTMLTDNELRKTIERWPETPAAMTAQALIDARSEIARLRAALDLTDYDAGLFGDYGGGDVSWWHDYLRAEISRCNDHWKSALVTP